MAWRVSGAPFQFSTMTVTRGGSFPGIFQRLTRPERVKVKALNEHGQEFIMEAEGLTARAILHEYDHLDGTLFIDHFSSINRALVDRKLKKLAKSA